MPDITVKQSSPVGRPRNEPARQAVLKAAYSILVENELNSFSIDGVAQRSGVARTTIYRWWPTKGILAIESFLQAFRPQLVYTPTSDVVADLKRLVHSLVNALNGPAGRIAASVVAEAQRDPETRRLFVEAFSEPLREESGQLLARGIAHGEFRADLDVSLMLDAMVGAIYWRLLLCQPLSSQWADALCELLLRGSLADGI
ncbi:TetR/AcrR family transcriptional regulator C-terminal ligand-binding domain-containing protein [Rhizobium tumorigenes]|uniref:TetR/AcrR family transcriptional regulator C-terminal ligand-binding domain-containing protein n=1 Tax=Rhizobium tumorigenes TaxID=2041385 RepID=A0AAF1K889_9HYPH|nr:TetR/AcrR family transcriptional regulator C-terminal ligand-binding domain-containing protein [Rhizobium tumorigenes]WFR97843.1 TetR/AcrR family transcriptional regulator C-terminal ligand-binding domain-containing protein [Rhizobium tumorigenes]